MKNGFYFLGGLLLLAGACTEPDSYRLVGNLSGLADGTRMLLVPAATHKQEKPIGEAVVEDGKFVFEGQLPEPRLLNLQAEGKQLYYAFMLENGEVTITGEAVSTTDGDREMVTLNKAVVTGSKADREFREKIAFRQELDKAYTRLHQKYEDISRQWGEARRTGNAVKIDSLNQTEEMKAYARDEKAFFTQVEKQTMASIKANKDSYWGPLLMLYCFNYFTEDPAQIELYNSFPEEIQNGYYGQLLKKELIPENLIGKRLPAFSAPDRNGNIHSDSDLRKNKKCVLIDFWASWCGPCRREIPNLKKIYEAYVDKGLEIISISIDKEDKAWQKALDEEQLPWPNLIDRQELFGEQFYGRTIPAIFLVTEDGIVQYDKLRGQALSDKIAEILN